MSGGEKQKLRSERQNDDKNSIVVTNEFKSYAGLDGEYFEHHVINHGRKEYVRGRIHINTAEGYFSLLKRGITGIYHHMSEKIYRDA